MSTLNVRTACTWIFAVVVTGSAVAAADFSPPQARTSEVVTVSDADNGRTIEIVRGSDIQIVLRSTYWQIKGSSNSAVLAAVGSSRTQSNRAECVPGGGCGTVTQSFTAVAAGRAEVSADRDICGEALRCRPEQRHFTVSVIVSE